MNKEIIFQSENIDYIELTIDLVNEYLEMVNDLDSQKLITNEPKIYTYEDEYNWVLDNLEKNSYTFSMIERSTGNFVGNVEIMHIKGKSAEVGIIITKEYQNKHYGTEAIKRLIEYAFNELNLEELTAVVFSINGRSLHCCEKVGFKIYKIDKNVCVIDNQEVDDVYLRLIK